MQLPALKILAASVTLKPHVCALCSVGPLSSVWTLTGCTVAQGVPQVQIQGAHGLTACFFFSWRSQSCPAFDTVLKMVASCILHSFMVGYDRGADPVPVNCAVTGNKELTILPQAFFPYVVLLRTHCSPPISPKQNPGSHLGCYPLYHALWGTHQPILASLTVMGALGSDEISFSDPAAPVCPLWQHAESLLVSLLTSSLALF